jgi:hypothetical protein
MAIIETLKSIKTKILTMGTPKKEKVLYSEITKRVDIIEEITLPKVDEIIKELEDNKEIVSPIKDELKQETKPLSKKEQKIALYKEDILHHFKEVDEEFLAIVVKNLGPSIYRANAEIVSCDKDKELKTVKNNFLIKKLGLSKGDERLDTMINEVCKELSNTDKKYRATFYYRLAIKFDKKEVLS